MSRRRDSLEGHSDRRRDSALAWKETSHDGATYWVAHLGQFPGNGVEFTLDRIYEDYGSWLLSVTVSSEPESHWRKVTEPEYPSRVFFTLDHAKAEAQEWADRMWTVHQTEMGLNE